MLQSIARQRKQRRKDRALLIIPPIGLGLVIIWSAYNIAIWIEG